jgi:hypothetical protein
MIFPCFSNPERIGLDDRERAITGHFLVSGSVSKEFAHDVAAGQHADDTTVAHHWNPIDILVGHHR